MRWIAALALVITAACWAPTTHAQAYYVKLDQSWYPVQSGVIDVALASNTVDAPQAVLGGYCYRSGGGFPPNGTHFILLGGPQFVDFVYANAPLRFHATTPPVVEILTPFGDVACGPGITPPASVLAQMNQIASGLFSNGFEP